MAEGLEVLSRPIRVVVFAGGPALERGVRGFLCRLEDHPEIDLLACICQSVDQSASAVMRDLWRRRGLLAIPLLAVQAACKVGMAFRRDEREIDRKIARLSERIFFASDIHAEGVLHRVRELSPDMGLIYGSPILKPALFEIPRFGTLGIHHGMAPKYRGKKTTFWEVYNGEPTAGVMIQKVNAGLDTGEILRRGTVPIGRRSLGAVRRDLHTLGLDLYIDAIVSVKRGSAVYRPQEGPKGKLCRDPKIRDYLVLWRRILLGKLRLRGHE
jgi:folate-dependent phosphoribosylglycinamide formyltransferase PurN